MRTSVRLSLMMLALLCVVSFGCKKGLPLQETVGTITCGGSPVAEATVTFVPDTGNKLGQPAMATTDAQGAYSMTVTSGEGVPEGKYQVTVTPKGFGGPLQAEYSWQDKYTKASESGLEANVVSGKNTIDFELDAK